MLVITRSNLSSEVLKKVFDSVYVDCRPTSQGLMIFDDFRVHVTFDPDKDRLKYFTTLSAPHGLSKPDGLEYAFKISKEHGILAEYCMGTLCITSTLFLDGGIPCSMLIKALRRFVYTAHDLVFENLWNKSPG